MTEEPNWTEWMNYEHPVERSVYRDEAEKNQISFEKTKNCRMIHVRGKLVGAVDFETDVRLRLHSETSPALVFGRRGDPLYLFVYLHEWER